MHPVRQRPSCRRSYAREAGRPGEAALDRVRPLRRLRPSLRREIRLRSLVELTGMFGVTEPTIRVVTARMRKEGWFDTRKGGTGNRLRDHREAGAPARRGARTDIDQTPRALGRPLVHGHLQRPGNRPPRQGAPPSDTVLAGFRPACAVYVDLPARPALLRGGGVCRGGSRIRSAAVCEHPVTVSLVTESAQRSPVGKVGEAR